MPLEIDNIKFQVLKWYHMLVFIKWRWPLDRNEGMYLLPSSLGKIQNYAGLMQTCIGTMHAATVSVSSFLPQSCFLAGLCL